MSLVLAPILSFAKSLDTQRNDFIEAYNILHKGGFYAGSNLKDYPLYSYLEYERIKQRLKLTNNQALINFINQYPDSYLADKLRSDLLVRLAKDRRWTTLLKFYKEGQGGNKAKCAGLEARYHSTLGEQREAVLTAAKTVWLSGNPRPNSCTALFDLLRKNKKINNQDLWHRISLAMDKGKTTFARNLAKNTKHKTLTSLWVNTRKSPSKNLKSKLLKKDRKETRDIIAYGIKRIARKDTSTAKSKWKQFQKTHRFTQKEKANVNSYIAVRDALDHKSSSLKQFTAIPGDLRSSDANIWMARTAVRDGNWNEALQAINSMTEAEKKQDAWRYWKTYSSQRLGDKAISEDYQNLAKDTSFYGFLAADQLNRPYSRLAQKEPNWDQFIPQIKKIKGITRATELYSIGFKSLAQKEWLWEVKKLSNHDKLVAAAYALKINQPFLAIVTVSQTKDWNQVGLRFPLQYQDLVKSSAQNQGITPAWVYGIMRKESAFDPKISSSANAKGLMQILPRTAKEVARKLGIKNHRTSDLLIPEKNTRLGAAYLSQMLKRFKGNYAKATASYNAGPHRIPRWTPKHPIVAPRWIESIPFNETRKYVSAVMAYTTIYDYKLNHKTGKNLRLSDRLHPVGGNQ